ncbi:unnamed protein product [Phytophthora lilii]|uniref:Unnamed protein product n=1 Tax=Phytophthora lilii TaxID=2077276 RepID=A0A9W6THL9_9STRA|nr:unnamed protein product [Phytophthora lilii]
MGLKKKATHALVVAWELHLSEEAIMVINDFVETERRSNIIPTIVLVGFTKLTIAASLKMWANLIIVSPVVQVKKNFGSIG